MFDSSVFTVNETNLKSRIDQANFYLVEYEKEVALAQGASNANFRNKEDALGRVKVLVEYAPDDERVKELYARAKACVKGGAGNISEVDPAMTKYLEDEENLRRHFAEVSEKAWNKLLEEHTEGRLERMIPAPDPNKYIIDDLMGKIVILDNVRYPDNQFVGTAGEYVWVGKRSEGMYFIKIDSRDWLGPYEAVKRYRRQVDTTMMDVKEWSIIGTITNFACESPDAGENKVLAPVMGWEVTPIALYVPGHVMAVYDANGEHTGRFIDEEKVPEMKEAWYTVKEVPADVTPERLVEIYVSAIKEKNFDLYMNCIDPSRRQSPTQMDLVNYYWDLHQERFHGEYIHANVDAEKTEIKVTKGFDNNSIDNFFLDDDDIAKIQKASGDKEEEATVQTVALDKNGKQLGRPIKHTLKRTNNGRWYVFNYELRF